MGLAAAPAVLCVSPAFEKATSACCAWAAHVVHHSSRHFNLGTAFRNGWVVFFYKPIFWLWLPALGFPPVMVVLAMSCSSLYQFFLHSQKIPHLGWVEKVFNTPQLHQVHHACNYAFLDKNHGGVLIVWDRLFGTYLDSRHPEPRQFGVLSPPASHHPWAIFAHEFEHLGHDVRQAASWPDKLKYVFYPPGWGPNNSGQTARQLQAHLATPRRGNGGVLIAGQGGWSVDAAPKKP